jgi:NAD(P)H-flavin reductase
MVDTIEGMGADWLSEFKFIPILSEEPADSSWRGRRGLVTETLAELLRADPALIRSAQAYMCGPPPMIDSAVSVLVEAGLDIGDIHYDKFTDSLPLS